MIKEFKVEWTEPVFYYHSANKFHIHTHSITETETVLCIHTDSVPKAFRVEINDIIIEYCDDRSIVTSVAYERQKNDNRHVHFYLPFQLTSLMEIKVTGTIERMINVAEHYKEGFAKFKLVSTFDPVWFPRDVETIPDTVGYVISLGDDTNRALGSDLVRSWTKKNKNYWEYK